MDDDADDDEYNDGDGDVGWPGLQKESCNQSQSQWRESHPHKQKIK